MAAATTTAPSGSLAQFLNTRRGEDVIHVAIPVKLSGDARGLSPEWTCTYEVTPKDVRLNRTPSVKSVGQEIWLQRNNRRARFRITWINEAEAQFRAQCLEDKPIWDDDVVGRLRR
jgi:hypothetical protein